MTACPGFRAWALAAAHALCTTGLASSQTAGQPDPAVHLTLLPSSAVAALNETVAFEVQTSGIDGGPLAGLTVSFEVVEGPDLGFTALGTTGSDGSTSFLLANVGGVGTDEALARLSLRSTERGTGPVEAHATVAWTCTLHQSHYGWPTPGAGPVPQVQVGSCFYVGQVAEVLISGSQPMSPGWLLIGLDQDFHPLAGGSLFVDPLIVLPFFLGPDGEAHIDLALPQNPGLQGSGVYFQALNVDPGAVGGLAMSDGLQAIVGA